VKPKKQKQLHLDSKEGLRRANAVYFARTVYRKTLAEIGREHNLQRERIRQMIPEYERWLNSRSKQAQLLAFAKTISPIRTNTD